MYKIKSLLFLFLSIFSIASPMDTNTMDNRSKPKKIMLNDTSYLNIDKLNGILNHQIKVIFFILDNDKQNIKVECKPVTPSPWRIPPKDFSLIDYQRKVDKKCEKSKLLSCPKIWINNILHFIPIERAYRIMRTCKPLLLMTLYHVRKIRKDDPIQIDVWPSYEAQTFRQEWINNIIRITNSNHTFFPSIEVAIFSGDTVSDIFKKCTETIRDIAPKVYSLYIANSHKSFTDENSIKLLNSGTFINLTKLKFNGEYKYHNDDGTERKIPINKKILNKLKTLAIHKSLLRKFNFPNNLKKLKLVGCIFVTITDEMPSISFVVLKYLKFSNIQLESFSGASKLKLSKIKKNRNNKISLTNSMSKLRRLRIENSDLDLSKIHFDYCKNLLTLHINNSYDITGYVKKISNLGKLERVVITNTDEDTETCIDKIKDNKTLPNLKYLYFKSKTETSKWEKDEK